MIKTKTLLPLIAIAFIFTFFISTGETFAASDCSYLDDVSPSNALNTSCLETGGQGQNCLAVGQDWFYKSSCRLDSFVQNDAFNCFNNRRVTNGSSGCTNACLYNGEILCGSSCKVSEDISHCTSEHRSGNTCTGVCGACLSGFEQIDGVCTGVCGAGYYRGTDGQCYAIDEFTIFEKLTEMVYEVSMLGKTFAEKNSEFDTILENTQNNAAYYLLRSTYKNLDDDNNKVAYYYGTGGPRGADTGDKNDDTHLEADWADYAGTADNINWYNNDNGTDDNPPNANENLPNIIQEIIENWYDVNLCREDLDCTESEETCINGFCSADGGSPVGPGGSSDPVWVGVTTASYDGKQGEQGKKGGYIRVNNYCDAEFSGSHVCTEEEILTLINNGEDFGSYTGSSWVNGGSPGYTQARANDCQGWTNNSGTEAFGRWWDFNTNSGWLANCSNEKTFVCCN